MDVRCDRCKAEYEFDDALLSSRGTKVRCTRCGHQFQIGGQGSDEPWVVITAAGAEHAFETLRELQHAIVARTVGPDDQLTRGSLPPRPLCALVELDPFFRAASATEPRRTQPASEFALRAAPPASPSVPRVSLPDTSTPLPRIGRVSRSSGRRSSGDILDSLDNFRRRHVGGWVIAAVLAAGALAMAVAVARPYLVAHRASTSDLDPRAMLFLGDAEKALAAGNLELAKENLDKASVLAEHDPRVLRAFARLAVIRADVVWLKNRLTPASDDPLLRERASTARKAVELAVASSPSDVLLVQLQVDALRIAGERDAARALVGKMNADSAQPETAYVLAALDMAESEPLWRTVLDRLHLALQGEGALGRARSALVYASVRAGDLETANAELDKLGRFAPGHPLLVDLRTFVLSAQAKSLVDAGADTHRPVHKTPARDAGGSAAKDPTARDRFEAALARNPNDPEALVGLGSLARRSGDTSRALGFFKRAVAANPSYLPALVGLADAYWDSGQRGEAVGIYRDIVERFPERSYPVHVKQRALASL